MEADRAASCQRLVLNIHCSAVIHPTIHSEMTKKKKKKNEKEEEEEKCQEKIKGLIQTSILLLAQKWSVSLFVA